MPRHVLLHLINLIFSDDQLALSFTLVVLKLSNMLLKLPNDISQLLVLLGELILKCLKANFIELVTLGLNFLKLIHIEPIFVSNLGRANFQLQVCDLFS